MSLGDPAFGPTHDRLVAELDEANRVIDAQRETIRQLDMKCERLALAEVGACDEIRAVYDAEARIVADLRAGAKAARERQVNVFDFAIAKALDAAADRYEGREHMRDGK